MNEQVLLKERPKPETLALIRSGHWQEGLNLIEPLNLQGRHLRQARMAKVILLGADLRKAQLQGADLLGAQLQGANFWGARLQGADLLGAQLQGADLGEAQLQGAELRWAELQGADLGEAQLQGAILVVARLQGADLWRAQLQGANLGGAKLQGANLWKAQLQGASLRGAQLQGANLLRAQLQGAYLWKAQLQGASLRGALLQGADLRGAQLEGADLWGASFYAASINSQTNTELIDARGAVWKPLPSDESRALSQALSTLIKDPARRQEVLARLAAAARPDDGPSLSLESCLAPPETPLVCDKRYDPEKPEELADFKKQLQAYLAELACESPWIAQGLIKQIELAGSNSSRQGLEVVLKNRLDDKKCPGLQGLSQKWKNYLKAIK